MSKNSTKKQLAAAAKQLAAAASKTETCTKSEAIEHLVCMVKDYDDLTIKLDGAVKLLEKTLKKLQRLQDDSNELFCEFEDFKEYELPALQNEPETPIMDNNS